MRAARSVLTPILARLRWAVACAVGLSLLAALAAPAYPLLLMHGIDLAQHPMPLDGMVLVALLAAAAAFGRWVLLAARDAVLVRTAFWLDHSAGRVLLSDGLQQAASQRRFEADRLALTRLVQALAGPGSVAALDALAVVPLAGFVTLVHPALGFIALAAVAVHASIGYRAARGGGARAFALSIRQAEADAQWRVIGGNAPMLLMRGQSTEAVSTWAAADRAAVAVGYQLAQRTALVKRVSDVVGASVAVTTLGVGVGLVHSEVSTLAGLSAAVIAMAGIHVAMTRAVAALPDLAAAEAGLAHLAQLREQALFVAPQAGARDAERSRPATADSTTHPAEGRPTRGLATRGGGLS